MRICQCGGSIGEGELTTGRVRWECRACGRYEIFGRSHQAATLPLESVSDAAVPCRVSLNPTQSADCGNGDIQTHTVQWSA